MEQNAGKSKNMSDKNKNPKKNKHAANQNRCAYICTIEKKSRHSRHAPAIKYAGNNVLAITS
jgi:hypothetical protein